MTNIDTLGKAGALGLLLVSLGALLVSGCLYRTVSPPQPELSVHEVWMRFQHLQSTSPVSGRGVNLKAGLDLFSEQESHHLFLELWGNYSFPLRLDLKGGFGKTVAMWRVEKGQWLSYVPDRQQAYIHPDSRIGVGRMGFVSPFDIQELLFLLSGQWQDVVPSGFQEAEYRAGQGYRYVFAEGGKIRELVLDRDGRPLEISGGKRPAWNMSFSKYARLETRLVPFRVHLKNSVHEEILINIKKIEPDRAPWSKSSLKLELPEETEIVDLES